MRCRPNLNLRPFWKEAEPANFPSVDRRRAQAAAEMLPSAAALEAFAPSCASPQLFEFLPQSAKLEFLSIELSMDVVSNRSAVITGTGNCSFAEHA